MLGARGRGKGRGGRGRGGRRNRKDEEEEEQHQANGGKAEWGKADNTKGDSAKCKRCGETGHKFVCCSDMICGVNFGKSHSVKICANVVTVFACEDSDAAISGEKKEAFVCDMLGEYSDKSNDDGGYSVLAWQVGDLTVICDSGASCHMSHSSTGMLTTANRILICGWRAVRDTRSRVMATYHLPFDLVLVMYLCCFEM